MKYNPRLFCKVWMNWAFENNKLYNKWNMLYGLLPIRKEFQWSALQSIITYMHSKARIFTVLHPFHLESKLHCYITIKKILHYLGFEWDENQRLICRWIYFEIILKLIWHHIVKFMSIFWCRSVSQVVYLSLCLSFTKLHLY